MSSATSASGNFVEVGVGVGYYRGRSTSVYLDYVNDNGFEIAQELKLRMVPVTVDGAAVPVRPAQQPCSRTSAAAWRSLNWRYSETGEFVDFNNDNEVFRDQFVDDGNEAAPVVLGGVRFPVGDAFRSEASSGSRRGKADLDPDSGLRRRARSTWRIHPYLATFQFRF